MGIVVLYNTINAWDIIDTNNVRCEAVDFEYIILCQGEYDRIAGTGIGRYLAA